MERVFFKDGEKGMDAKEILDTSVAMERKEGIITVFSAVEYPPTVKQKFSIIFPEASDYVTAISIADALRAKGTPIGAVDILIASVCHNRMARLVTKDKDFEYVQKVMPNFLVKFM